MVDRRRKKLINEGGEKRYMRIKRNEKGITLIALIITIIILVILAAVSIRAVTNMGIVGHAINGTQDYARGAVQENQMLGDTGNTIDSALARLNEIQGGSSNNNNNTGNTDTEVPDKLKKYVLGAQETGRPIYEIFASDAFKAGTEADIADANTTVLYMNQMYDSNYLDTDYTYYLYVKYQDIGYRISVTKNASTSNAAKTTGLEVVYVPNGMEGQIKKYSVDGTETPTDWLVLYDNGNTVDITPITLGTSNDWKYTLGKTDPAAVAALPFGTDLEKAQWSHEHMVESLNAKCEALVTNPSKQKVRSIGTQFDIQDTTARYSSTFLANNPVDHKTQNAGDFNEVGLTGDMNGEQDVVRMSFFSPGDSYQKYGYANVGNVYWLASRFVWGNSYNADFNARLVDSSRGRQRSHLPQFVVCGFVWGDC